MDVTVMRGGAAGGAVEGSQLAGTGNCPRGAVKEEEVVEKFGTKDEEEEEEEEDEEDTREGDDCVELRTTEGLVTSAGNAAAANEVAAKGLPSVALLRSRRAVEPAP